MNLQLSLKKQWFEMTKAGIKTEDYREITDYWQKRLFSKEYFHSLNVGSGFPLFRKYNTTTLTLGYPKSTDTERIIKFEHAGIKIGYGKPEWGAEPNKLYFIIKHGKIV